MSAPYIIPFNFQPSLSGVSTGTYTVPAGKYAYVNLGNAILPLINSVAMYATASILPVAGPFAFANAQQITNLTSVKGVHRVNVTVATTAVNLSFGLSANAGMLAGGTNGHIYVNVGSNSLTFAAPMEMNAVSTFGNGGAGTISALTVDIYNGPESIWLKPGDVVTFTSGNVIYTEYNVIS